MFGNLCSGVVFGCVVLWLVLGFCLVVDCCDCSWGLLMGVGVVKDR